MKSSTKQSHYERIERVVGFLSEQVENNPSLEALADIAAISPFHFHRVYRAVTGETPSGTVRRLRLVKACHLLKDSSKTITEIAFDVGYDSSQSFAKAFRSATGHSASSIRTQREVLDSLLTRWATSGSPKLPHTETIEVKVVSVDPFEVVANRYIGEHKGLFNAYGELFSWAQENGLVEQFRGIYGVPIDDPRDMPDDCRFDCCFDFGPKAETGQRYQSQKLGGGLFAVARHFGPYDGLEEKYDFLFGPWLNQSDYVLREQAFFNHYVQDPDTVPPEEWETDIYIPIQKM